MLADRAVTIVPEPAEGHGREDIREAVERVPRLLRLLESWRWSGPLWRAGLMAGQTEADRAFACIVAQNAAISSDASLGPLGGAALSAFVPGDEADRWLDSFCSDLLRGGPDPRLTTAATAALDSFAARHGLASVRGSTDSLAQRAELRLMRRAASVAIPVMSRAAGGRVLELRRELKDELAELRSAIIGIWSAVAGAPGEVEELDAAAAAYSSAFERWFASVARDDENAERTMRDFVSISIGTLPADAALVCARAAIRTTARVSGRSAESATVVRGEPASQLRTLIVRPMNVRPV
jgi:hypothetical protein